LATWYDGTDHYIVGRFHGPGFSRKDDRYRCLVSHLNVCDLHRFIIGMSFTVFISWDEMNSQMCHMECSAVQIRNNVSCGMMWSVVLCGAVRFGNNVSYGVSCCMDQKQCLYGV